MPTTKREKMVDQRLRDRRWLWAAIELSRLCPPSDTAYSVGAIIVGRDGSERSRGYSRDEAPFVHAEESALAKLAGIRTDLSGATMYTSMEPCSTRRSGPRTCSDLIIAAGLARVVLAMREPPVFVRCVGVEALRGAGVEVVTVPEFGAEVAAVNAAVLAAGKHRAAVDTSPTTW
jgi:diaminohydroxyphosphoribosylaminopyrimidine deaminase/5-amino-6-(5-phosphoribosylamino)uracil reductase